MAGRPSDGAVAKTDASRSGEAPVESVVDRNEALPPGRVERCPSRIVRSALDEVRSIQTLLSDVYKDAGDGRTLLRELVQNADDAGAERLVFAVLERGWPEAQNSLLQGPALLVANNGRFPAKDRDALHRALGGSKADDAGKVGRFGVGLKSVFHICEALVYVGAEGGVLRPGALNPWAGTGEGGDADPIHPDWDVVTDEDLEKRLLKVANLLLGNFADGLLQWIPLRRPAHLDRALDGKYGLGQVCPAPDDLAAWFGRQQSLALLLAQCGRLRSIEADHAVLPDKLHERSQLARVFRRAAEQGEWVGRYVDDPPRPDRAFSGRIETGRRSWPISGIEALGSDRLRAQRSGPDWPKDPHWREGRSEWVPRKALAHASITVLQPDGGLAERCGVRLRWAVFLPLDDDPNPRTNPVVEAVGGASVPDLWDIILHGYFWPSHDRRSIPGVTDDDAGAGDNAVRSRWNRAVRDELLLPLLPSALANAVTGTPETVARRLLKAIATSRTIEAHLPAVIRRQVLLPVITPHGVSWTAFANGVRVVSIPAWTRAPSTVRQLFAARVAGGERGDDDITFIDADAPRLGSEVNPWPSDWLACLLECVAVDALRTSSDLEWVDAFVRHVVGPVASATDERVAAVANWLAKRIGEGALAPTTEGSDQESLRAAWRRVFTALPEAWLVDAPVATQQAVTELASQGFVGEGLLPIPFGRGTNAARAWRPESDRLDRALRELGQGLSDNEASSQRAHRSRLLLAETFLSVRSWPLPDELSRLPLLRAQKLPDEKDEAWSVGELHRQTERARVFARPGADDGVESVAPESPSDPKRAVKDLAEAVNEKVWLVHEAVGSAAGAPVPTTTALADAVAHSTSIQSSPLQRIGLLRRLAGDATDPRVRRAVRSLLTGRVADSGEEGELFYVRSQDSDREANRRTLRILLGLLGRPWCAVEPGLVEPLPHALVEDLRVNAVDGGVLHGLLAECLEAVTDWSRLEQPDVLHLLRRMYGSAPDDRARWRAMPLHRGVGGDRGSFDDRALRAVGELRLPSELEAEIRLLDPERELADLYLDVPALDDDGVLRAMLVSRRPYQFANQIVRALRSEGDGRVILPRDPKLVALLRQASWLAHRDGSSGLAPEMVLVVPRELRPGIAVLGEALGEHRLPEDVAPAVWGSAESVVHEILGRPSPARQVQHLAGALAPAKVADVDGGAFLILPNSDRVTHSLVEDALQSPLAGSHPGWGLVRTAVQVVGSGVEKQLHDAVVELARALCGPLSAARQASVLTAVAATHPLKDSPSGRLFRSLIECFSATARFFEDVLPQIELPTQDGQWHPAREVARSASGVARRHRVVSDLRSSLRLDSDDPVRAESAGDVTIGSGTADSLAKYFKPWIDRLPHGAVGAFIGILGNRKDNAIARLAEEWLGDDVNIEGMRRDLISAGGRDPWATVKVFVSGRVARGKRVEAINLLGDQVEMEAGSDDDTVFATDPVRRSSALGDFWEIGLREVEPKRRTAHELVALLGGTVEWWAARVLGLDVQKVRDWWSRWGTGSQAQVAPVQASILAHLPLTLLQLDVHENEGLRDALRDAQRAQRKREQATPAQIRDAMDTERTALDKLASLIREHPDHQRFIWSRVQELMRRFGYRDDSVLLELAQNADDALSQAAEIIGGPLPPAARRLVVRVHARDGVTTLDVTHHGRPINDTGGAAFPAGRDRQWDQDLYFMMLLNLSGKPGEAPGQTTAASTTGRFGLGFKSVHLVSDCPSVVSGFVAFSIAGGLLPLEQPVPDEPDLQPLDGHRATRVRLRLRTDIDQSSLVADVFRRFAYARALLPVFARQLREVIVDGGPTAGISVFAAQPIDGAAGWSVADRNTEISGKGQWRILRFRPADREASSGTGTAAIAVGLNDGKPAPFPIELPFLWNVTPTSEGWGCGYAVNGPFKLDPGRTHVSLDDDATGRVVDLLGEALGRGLIELNDSLLKTAGGPCLGLPVSEVPVFVASLWKVLASGIDTPDELRWKILLRLHGSGRGLSAWMGARSVVPSDLPAPFSDRLPPLKPGIRVEVAEGGLGDRHLCGALAQIPDLASLAGKHPVVSREVAERLRPLLSYPARQIDAADLLAELMERWDHVLTPDRLHELRPLDAVWRAIPNGPAWHAKLVARAADGTSSPLRELLLPRDGELEPVEADVEDELLRAAFAPDRRVLHASYISRTEDLTLFLRLRVRLQIDARTIATWYSDLVEDRRPAALAGFHPEGTTFGRSFSA